MLVKKLLLGVAFASSYLTTSTLSASFAGSLIGYDPGSEYTPGFTNASAALGAPSRITPGMFGGVVDVFNPPYLTNQIVSIGSGGSITLQMDQPVANAPENLYGMDFIVFANSGFVITNGDFGGGGITDGSVFGFSGAGVRISVSNDGTNYFELAVPDDRSLTAFPSDGSGDFHTPIAPSYSLKSFAGKGITEIRQLYAGSGGGMAFDIGWARDSAGHAIDLGSVEFVRIDVLSGSAEIDGIAAVTPDSERTGVTPKNLSRPFEQWSAFGETNLFAVETNGVAVTWDSLQTNSYFFLPLGMTLTRTDHFRLSFTVALSDIVLGTTPGKPYTFEIAAGLLNLSNAFDPEFYRGTGVNAVHGPRNLIELSYFPDSGFGATVAPTIATEENEILFSDNHPIELKTGIAYTFEMEFTPKDQTLRTVMIPQLSNTLVGNPLVLRELVVPATYKGFGLNAVGIASYSDAGQVDPFAGSVTAEGSVSQIDLVVYERPRIEIARTDGGFLLKFESSSGRVYSVEGSEDTIQWNAVAGPFVGTGSPITVPVFGTAKKNQIFRVRADAQ